MRLRFRADAPLLSKVWAMVTLFLEVSRAICNRDHRPLNRARLQLGHETAGTVLPRAKLSAEARYRDQRHKQLPCVVVGTVTLELAAADVTVG